MFMESVSVNCSFAGVSCRCTLLRDGFTAIGWCGGSRVALCRTQWVQSCKLSTVPSNDALSWSIPGGGRRGYYYGLYRYVSLWRVWISSSLLQDIDCKTVVFFANVSDGPYSNERSGASVKTARSRGSRLQRFPPSENARKRLFCSLSRTGDINQKVWV